MSQAKFTIRELLEAGVHFGHYARRWNPKMEPFIYGQRNKIHIMDLRQTVPMLHHALNAVQEITARGGRVLFVSTKHQAQDSIAEAAKRCGQYYVNHRWLGGMMTNWKTISKSIKRLKDLDEELSAGIDGLTKKELLNLTREQTKLERSLGGIRDMAGLPDAFIIIDIKREAIAVQEARKLGIPIIAVLDSNCDPDNIDYVIPGNDDSAKAIKLYCDLFSDAVLAGLKTEMDTPIEFSDKEEEVAPSDKQGEEKPLVVSTAKEKPKKDEKAAPKKKAVVKKAVVKKETAEKPKKATAKAESKNTTETKKKS